MAKRQPRLEVVDNTRKRTFNRRRGIYLLPNLITAGALFAGFVAIVAAVDGKFVVAGAAIFIAMVLDTLDGRVARLTRTESEFGAQFDSLSDMVAFGVGPAVIVFEWSLATLQQVGWFVTFMYMACAALRLARFNVAGNQEAFTGLPSPMAAGVLASGVWVFAPVFASQPGLVISICSAVLTGSVALLMVAPVRYFSPKVLQMRGRVPFVVLVVMVIVFALIVIDPPLVLFLTCVVYALSGPFMLLWKQYLSRMLVNSNTEENDDGSDEDEPKTSEEKT